MSDTQVLDKVRELLGEVLSPMDGIYPVDTRISPAHHIRVFLDADDGITIDRCTAVNRAVYRKIKASGLFPGGEFSLEVSSPGLDEPLKLNRQYQKNIGRAVEVSLLDGSRLTGKLVAADDQALTIEEKTGKGNKLTINTKHILFSQVKQTKVLITF